MGKRARPHPKPSVQPIPLHLKGWRTFRGLNQDRLAELIGTTAATISRIENGKQNWDQAFLQAAAAALQCEPADLIVRDPSGEQMLWSIWDQLEPVQREQVAQMAQVLRRTGTRG